MARGLPECKQRPVFGIVVFGWRNHYFDHFLRDEGDLQLNDVCFLFICMNLQLQDTPEFSDEMFWIFTGAEIAILSLAIFGCIGGFVQVQKLSHSFRQPYALDKLLASVTIVGAYIYAIFSMIASGINLGDLQTKNIVIFIQNALLLIQVSCQGK